MKAVFVQTTIFTADAKRLGLTDEGLQSLERAIMENPTSPPVLKGTGGIRKIRLPLSAGKSGGARACHAWFPEFGIVYLIAAFVKNEQSNLPPSERKALAKLVEATGKYMKARREWLDQQWPKGRS
jgi:hypothetical protein